jgi:histidyl-tRNA synthetase
MKTAHPKYAREAKLRPTYSKCDELVDTIEVKVKLDKKLYDSLSWYVKQTGNWVNNKRVEEFLSEWMTDSVSIYLERARDLSYYNGIP